MNKKRKGTLAVPFPIPIKEEADMLMYYLSMIESAEDRDKFERLYYKYRSLMMHVALSKLSDETLAEDCVHNAFLNILENMDKIQDVESQETKALLVIITQRRAVDIIRKYRKEITINEVSHIQDPGGQEYNTLVDQIRSLPQDQQSALILKYVYGYSTKDLAIHFGITPSGVRKLLGRAKNNLRKELEHETI